MSVPTIRPGLEHFCQSWNSLIEMLKTNYLVEPLLDRKINCETNEGERYVLTLTDSSASLADGDDKWAHATFRTDAEGWQDLLHGKLNFLTLAMQGRMRTSMDEALIHLRLGIIIQLLALMRPMPQ
ncbi:MAG: SCP2 sterol-binding domain-containing protein [Candidatus Hydrogenedentota bacterium]|nr:MAG: SCP2 sterol-binding domain-containing protein [Candidatus Hydrogenedentota bacterium]